jgi:hypothetical protein
MIVRLLLLIMVMIRRQWSDIFGSTRTIQTHDICDIFWIACLWLHVYFDMICEWIVSHKIDMSVCYHAHHSRVT